MSHTCENCKGPAEIARETAGTPTAKLIAILIAAGITDTAELSIIVGVTHRAVQYARQTKSASRNELRQTKLVSPNEACFAKPASPNETSFAKQASPPSRAHATKESPTEILISKEEEERLEAPTAKKPPRERGSRLSPDWVLPKTWGEWVEIHISGFDRQTILAEADKFRDFWIAKTGAGATKLDWQATWRNWCRTAKLPGRFATPYNPHRMADDERKARLHAEGKPATLREVLNQRAAAAAALEVAA